MLIDSCARTSESKTATTSSESQMRRSFLDIKSLLIIEFYPVGVQYLEECDFNWET